MFYAHSGNGSRRDQSWETVRDHLCYVSKRAACFAEAFGAEEQAELAGLLHDLGKYSAQFQRRLTDRREKSRDHWSLGALAAAKTYGRLGHFPAVAILGHHVGLEWVSNPQSLRQELSFKLTSKPDAYTTEKIEEAKGAQRLFQEDGFTIPKVPKGLYQRHDYVGDMLDIRLLFSALVDADFVETEAHFEGDSKTPRRPRNAGGELRIDDAIAAVEKYRERFSNDSTSVFFDLRQRLFENCVQAGRSSMLGNYTLSAPTGAGKTLAMLAFALEHAKQHGLRRIVLVMPFLNIIDQTARIYREIFSSEHFGDHYILEAHSLASRDTAVERCKSDYDGEDHANWTKIRQRLLAENWDAPIVLTTNVQILESLFASRPFACRKLHRLAGSVILFDEVQTLPPKLAVPTLSALARLSNPSGPYRSTVVFATATQPAFDSLSPRLQELVDKERIVDNLPTWNPSEIVVESKAMFEHASTRVRVAWEERQPRSFDKLADELSQLSQVLCVVNLKRHAIEIATLLAKTAGSVFHLSTNMCTTHRLAVLTQVNKRLNDGQEVRLVATQCIEAGVDIDFPVVYRALAPLEAIAQASGRCNRSGNRPTSRVVVFTLRDNDESGNQRRSAPPGYDFALRTTQNFLTLLREQHGGDLPEIIHSPQRLRDYFKSLYQLSGRDQTVQDDEKELVDAIRAGNFRNVASEYRLISEDALNVLVPYQQAWFDQLLVEATEQGELSPKQIRRWIAMARPHSVSLYRPSDAHNDLYLNLLPIQFGNEQDERQNQQSTEIDWWYPTQIDRCYDERIGLQLAEPQWIM